MSLEVLAPLILDHEVKVYKKNFLPAKDFRVCWSSAIITLFSELANHVGNLSKNLVTDVSRMIRKQIPFFQVTGYCLYLPRSCSG